MDVAGQPACPTRSSAQSAAAHSPHTDQISRLAASLDPRGALLIFPEGGNWTPLRWRRGDRRLHRRHRADLAERAAAMPNVLPPRLGGAFAAIGACPAADVIFVAHTGLDRLVSVRDVWQSLSGDLLVHAHWWRVPAADVPRDADDETRLRWLYDWWQRVDAWITAQDPSQQALSRSDPEIHHPERTPLTPDASPLSRQVADSLDVVPVRVAYEGGVVVLVILRPYPRLVQDRRRRRRAPLRRTPGPPHGPARRGRCGTRGNRPLSPAPRSRSPAGPACRNRSPRRSP